MIFLGIDPGLRKTGWGVIIKNDKQLKYLASGLIKSDKSSDLMALSLLKIFDSISKVISDYNPSHVAIENTYVNNNPLSSLKLAQARAAAITACAKHRLIPCEYQASTIKKIVSGKGNADKHDVQKMIALQLGYISIETHDETDAIAIAMCHALFQKSS